MRSWCWPEPNWILQAALIDYSILFTNRLREVHQKRKSEQRLKWTISSPNAEKAMQWLCAYGWTIRRMTSTKGESVFRSVYMLNFLKKKSYLYSECTYHHIFSYFLIGCPDNPPLFEESFSSLLWVVLGLNLNADLTNDFFFFFSFFLFLNVFNSTVGSCMITAPLSSSVTHHPFIFRPRRHSGLWLNSFPCGCTFVSLGW